MPGSVVESGVTDDCQPSMMDTGGLRHAFEPIAVIGMAVKFPADCTSLESFWSFLVEKKSALSHVTDQRYDKASFNPPNVDQGHFIKEDLSRFDAPFFAISPAEAEAMDPQQRWLLEASYHAFENAGITLAEASDSDTSVHVGSFTHDFETSVWRDPELPGQHRILGTNQSILANRISWFYNLKGPSILLDTACSSSLVAIDLACQSLRLGTTNMALVAGCNLFFDPHFTQKLSTMGFLSPNNKCYSFDDRADGYARGEGIGVIILKSLSQAVQDGNTIRAVIRATGINQDGRTPGITQPSWQAQKKLICSTYQKAGLDMMSTSYVEAHGTGTPLGDPIEVKGIARAFRDTKSPIYVGSVKANIGHTEGASGIAGVIKTVLILENGLIPANIWLKNLNPRVEAEARNLIFPVETTPWPSDGLRRASVNSFGFGGTNAHIVLDDAFHFLQSHGLKAPHHTTTSFPARNYRSGYEQDNKASVDGIVEHGPKILTLSAFDETGIRRLKDAYCQSAHQWHDDDPRIDFNLAFTLSQKRNRLPWCTFAITQPSNFSFDRLEWSTPRRIERQPKVCFVFTGQGAQWLGMGAELLENEVFRKSIHEANSHLRTFGCRWSLIDKLYDQSQSPGSIDDPQYSQPICTILQIALVDLLSSYSIKPSVVLGHSSGDIASAYCSGAISRESAWKIAYYRGLSVELAMKLHPSYGSMMAVSLKADRLENYLYLWNKSNPSRRHLVIACYNSATNFTISGDKDALQSLGDRLKADDVPHRMVNVGVAYHSTHMTETSVLYENLVHNLSSGPLDNDAPIHISTVTGRISTREQLQTTEYWVSNLIEPVQFHQALRQVCSPTKHESRHEPHDRSADYIIEIGPHAALKSAIKDTLGEFNRSVDSNYSSVLLRNKPADTSLLDCIGQIYSAGYPVNLTEVNKNNNSSKPQMLTKLPPYPFNHSRSYWLEGRLSTGYRRRKHPFHALLGTPAPDWNELEARWNHRLIRGAMTFLSEHKVNGLDVYPAAGMLVMALEATKRLNSSSKSITAYRFRDVSFSSALVINSSSQGVETQLIIRPHRQESSKLESRWNEFRLFVYDNSTWSECCRGTISLEHHEPTWASESAGKDFDFLKKEVQPTKDRCESTLPNDYFYQVLSNSGLEYGPSFRGVGAVKGDYGGRATGIIDLHHWETHATERIEEHLIHPTALDSILHMALFTLFKSHTDKIPTVVPTAFKELWISEAITRETHIEACSYSTPQGFRNIDARLVGIGLGSNQVCLTADLVITALGDAKDDAVEHTPGDRKLYHLEWEPDVTAIKDERSLLSIVQKTNRIPMRNGTGHANSAKQRELLCQLVIREVLEKHVIATPGSSSHLSRYLDWMRYHTEKKKGTNSTPEQSQLEAMFDVVEQQGPIGELTVKVAKGLPTVLNGNIDPLEFFFSDDLLHRAYRSSSLWPANTLPQLCRYIELLAMKNPSIRILEIGAGTGSLTESILGALASHPTDYSHAPLYQEYVFTDISTGFFANAKMQFPDPKITFKVLDISQCPVKQGFEAESYDIVLASNVLHATSKLKTTLSNCRKLIKPGGRFILHECMSPRTLMPGFIFGLIPGWWAGTEPTRRWSPLISRSEWGVQLVEAGFPGGAELTIRDESEEDKEHPSAAVIVTTAPLRLSSASGPVSPSIIVVYNKSVSVQHAIAKEFQQQASTKQTAPVQVIDLEAARSVDVTGARCIFLVDVDVSFTKELQEPDLMLLKRACSDAQQILWITGASNRDESAEPSNGIIVGVARTVETEKPDLCFVTLNLEAPYDISRVCNHMTTVLESSGARSSPLYESEYAEIDGVLNVHRLVEAKQATRGIFEHDQRAVKTVSKWDGESDVRFKLGIGTLGLLDSLKHVEDVAPSSELRPDELDVEIVCAGLNFRDVLTALGQVDDDYFGSEFSGRVIRAGETARRRFSAGDSVMGFHKGTMASVIRCGDYQIHPLPSGLSFAAGASLPVVYCTAYYSLVTWAKARRGESVLIHSAAGGFGQASIQLCKSIGCQIYATVSSQEKAEMLVETYGVQRDHIFSSRTLDFAKGIKRVSNGKGVDIVLNSLAGEALRASWECIAPFGRFIEVGKKDIYSKEISVHSGLHMAPFAHTVMFASVNLNQISEHRDRIREIFERVVEMVESRTIGPPQPLNVFGSHEIERAFRFMQDGKRFGKVLVDYSVEEMVEMERLPMRRKIFHAHATYIISGGLGGIGMSICRWMVRKGARNVILFSRSQAVDEERRLFLSDMKNAGSKVVGIPCDISNRDQLTTAIRDIQSEMPPIKGCIQAAMVLHNVAFTNMSMEAWNSAINPKVHGSWNMHSLLPGGMDFFILLSSLSGVIGSYGQTNYTAGNAYQDELARYRVRNGEKAISIDLGSVKSVGYVASREDIQAYTERLGIDTVSERNLFQMLEYYCDPALPVQSELEAQVVTPMRTPAYFRSRGMVEPLWTRKSLFRLLHRVGQKDSVTTAAAAHMPSIERLLKQSASMLDAGEVVCQALRDRLAELLAVNRVDIDPTKPVHAYGVDSLAAVELKSWFKRMIGADVPVFELLGNGTIAELADKAARRSTIVKGLE